MCKMSSYTDEFTSILGEPDVDVECYEAQSSVAVVGFEFCSGHCNPGDHIATRAQVLYIIRLTRD